jgi:hypothetical protein
MKKGQITALFYMCVFPIHLWSMVVVFNHIESVIYRGTNVFDGIGYASYALLLALFESVILCLFLLLLGFLLPKHWPSGTRLVQLTLVGWVMLGWAAGGQSYQFWFSSWQKAFIDHVFLWLSFRRIFNPILLVVIFLLLLASVVIPLWLPLRWPGFRSWVTSLMEKLSILSIFYLGLDFLALLIVIFRNLWVLV